MGRRATAAPVVASKATVRMQQLPVFTNAMAEFKAEYPDFAKRGWGATVKAEVRFRCGCWTVWSAGLADHLSVWENISSWERVTVVTKRAVSTSVLAIQVNSFPNGLCGPASGNISRSLTNLSHFSAWIACLLFAPSSP